MLTTRLLWTGALLRKGDHRLPKKVVSGELENAGKRWAEWKKKQRTDCVAEDRRVFGIMGDWRTAALNPGFWFGTVCEVGCRFMAAWAREKGKAPQTWQKKR